MRKPASVATLTEFNRVQLSKSFFMRDFLYSEIAAVHGLLNVPSDPDLAIRVGRRLCEDQLEPLQDHWGRIAIRSAYRSAEVNAFGNARQKERVKGYSCASNEANAARHIWDMLDQTGGAGAMACIVVPAFWNAHQGVGDWRIMADWIEAKLPYSEMQFFPRYWAFNLSWHEQPKRLIHSSYVDRIKPPAA